MAITIIGAGASEAPTSPLPAPPSDLPHPNSAPAARRMFDAAGVVRLLGNKSALVRAFALEQARQIVDPAVDAAVIGILADGDPAVAVEAVTVISEKKMKAAVEPLLERFKAAGGELAAAIASALGQMAPETLLSAVQARGRLDDEAYAATATALAIVASDEVMEFLAKALNRGAALPPERRSSLYGAALLSGGPALSGRVIGLAIDDSREAEPPNQSFPTRAAIAAVAGLPMPYSRRDAGLELYDHAREELEQETAPALSDTERAALEDALKSKRIEAALLALQPVLAVKVPELARQSDDDDLGTMPKRRRGLLEALIERRVAIGKLELGSASVFLAAAARASSVILAGGLDESTSAAMIGLAKTLGGKLEPTALAALDLAALIELFKEKSPREMRPVLRVLTHEHFRRPASLRRFALAAARSGHVLALIEAAAESDDPRVHATVLKALSESAAEAEPAVIEILSASPLEPRSTSLALLVAEDLRTERLGLLIGRRFLELRSVARAAVARAIMRIGDPRLAPVIESRAFPDEVEELSWVVIAAVHGLPRTEKLDAAEKRVTGESEDRGRPEVRVPLECKRCHEILGYGFERVMLDVDSKDTFGDPAFVGDLLCKACGTADELVPIEESARILTNHLMQSLEAARSGRQTGPTLVAPAATEVRGKRMGLASALRELDAEVAASPEAIRPRLHRARVRLILKRRGVADDIAAILAADPNSVEAAALSATLAVREGRPQEAVEKAAGVIRRLASEENVRLYDVETPAALRNTLEEYLLELENIGTELPSDIALDDARARRQAREEAQMAAMENRRRSAGPPPPRAAAPEPSAAPDEDDAPAIRRQVGRNDPCPCGSGKKYKKCHGANA